MKKIIICICLVINILFIGNINISAYWIGPGESTPPSNEAVKAYVNDMAYDDLIEMGITSVLDINNMKYYISVPKYPDTPLNSMTYSQTMDGFIHAVDRLESFAKAYLQSNNLDSSNIEYINNLVLGYIRSINTSYCSDASVAMIPSYAIENLIEEVKTMEDLKAVIGEVGMHTLEQMKDLIMANNWQIYAGTTPDNFIEYVNENDTITISSANYFSRFVGSSNRNSDYNINNELTNSLVLVDPIDSHQMDLTHLVAAIDGIYEHTGSNDPSVSNEGLVSWAGDLQQRVGEKRFDSFESISESELISGSFNHQDLISDIDALNITKLFLDSGNTLFSNALSGYYYVLDNITNANRFNIFVKTIGYNPLYGGDGSGTELSVLKGEIYAYLGMTAYSNPVGSNLSVVSSLNMIMFASSVSLIDSNNLSVELVIFLCTNVETLNRRIIFAEAFYDYIVNHME